MSALTDWLQRLLVPDTFDGATLQWPPALSFREPFSWWLAVVGVLAVGILTFALYARERGEVGTIRRLLMALLRTAAFTLLFLLILRPVLVAEYRGERPRGTVILIDNSLSMTQRDRRLFAKDRLRVALACNQLSPQTPLSGGSTPPLPANVPTDPSRAELVRAILTNPQLHLVDDLKRFGPLKTYLFGRRLENTRDFFDIPEGSDPAQIPGLLAYEPSEPRTALADALNELLQGKEGDLPAAVVVLTDGLDNASQSQLPDVARECARLQVPLHLYGTGSPEGGILQLRDVGVPETLLFEDNVPVTVRWRAQGFRQDDVEIVLRLGGKEVARRSPTRAELTQKQAVLAFTPGKGSGQEEKRDLVASIRLKADDAFHDEVKRQVRIVDRRVRVLYIEDKPRWEYKFLQSALLRDRRVEVTFLLVNADERIHQPGVPFLPAFPEREKLFAFDVIVLGDVSASYLTTQRLEWLRDFVREGGGLIHIAGRQHAPASYVNTPLMEVLPVEFLPVQFPVEADARPQLFVPVLTDVGKRTDALAVADNAEESQRIWKELPGFSWFYPVTKLRPGATSLLDHPTAKMNDRPMPLVATHRYGKGEVFFLGSDETWRWRFNVGDKHFARFWGQLVSGGGLSHLLGSSQRVQLALDQSDIQLGRPGSVYARMFDRDYRPLSNRQVLARLDYQDARTGASHTRALPLEAVPGQPGEYRALLANDIPGRFEIKVEEPEPASLAYAVRPPVGHELETAGMAEESLREAATLSDGRFYREENLYQLAGYIEPRPATFMRRQEVLLWNPLALFLLVGLVTGEWILRKFANLS
jgi:uncharacterized membrane protein